jgi:hypothetical protein
VWLCCAAMFFVSVAPCLATFLNPFQCDTPLSLLSRFVSFLMSRLNFPFAFSSLYFHFLELSQWLYFCISRNLQSNMPDQLRRRYQRIYATHLFLNAFSALTISLNTFIFLIFLVRLCAFKPNFHPIGSNYDHGPTNPFLRYVIKFNLNY